MKMSIHIFGEPFFLLSVGNQTTESNICGFKFWSDLCETKNFNLNIKAKIKLATLNILVLMHYAVTLKGKYHANSMSFQNPKNVCL